jgi:Tfp pilus assembly protein PilF
LNFKLRHLLLIAIICGPLASVAGASPWLRAPVLLLQQTAVDNRVEQLISEALAALERGDETTAKASLERALAADPNNVIAHTYLGVLADRAGNLREAERHFAAAAIAAPLLSSARNNHGAILLKLGRTEQAAKQFEASLRLDKNQPSALVNLAQIRFSSGTTENLRTALNLFEQAYALAPDSEIARALTIVSLRLRESALAAKYYRDYSQRLASAGTELQPTALARAELGGALLEAGLFKEAVEELKIAVNADSSNADAIVRLARAYVGLKDIPSAGRTLESAVARGLDAAPIYAQLADVYERSGHIENAIPAMRLAIQHDPQSETYRFSYGLLLTRALAPAAAIIRLEEAIKLFPRSPRLWFALGIAQFKQSKNNEAANAFKRALELDPKFAPAIAYLGLTYEELGQYEEAVKFYDNALAVDDKMAVTSYLAATVLLKQNTADLSPVEDYLRRAIKLDSSFAQARLSLAKLLVRTNRFEEAAAELERVNNLEPDLAEAYYQLGRLYVRLKRPAEAQKALDTFKRLSETQKEQAQNERRAIARRLANVNF